MAYDAAGQVVEETHKKMKFTISCQRAFIGNNIDVQVEAGDGELIFAVQCTLDDFEIGSDDLSASPSVSYHRLFSQVGDARSGLTHKLLVRVQGKDGSPDQVDTQIWTDAM